MGTQITARAVPAILCAVSGAVFTPIGFVGGCAYGLTLTVVAAITSWLANQGVKVLDLKDDTTAKTVINTCAYVLPLLAGIAGGVGTMITLGIPLTIGSVIVMNIGAIGIGLGCFVLYIKPTISKVIKKSVSFSPSDFLGAPSETLKIILTAVSILSFGVSAAAFSSIGFVGGCAFGLADLVMSKTASWLVDKGIKALDLKEDTAAYEHAERVKFILPWIARIAAGALTMMALGISLTIGSVTILYLGAFTFMAAGYLICYAPRIYGLIKEARSQSPSPPWGG